MLRSPHESQEGSGQCVTRSEECQFVWIKWTCLVRAAMRRKKGPSVRPGNWTILTFLRAAAHHTETPEMPRAGDVNGR